MAAVDTRRERFEQLVGVVHDPLMRYVRRRVPAGDADDVMSDVLLTLWRRLDDVPGIEPMPWCYAVARRVLANHRRSGVRRLRLVERLQAEPAAMVDQSAAQEHPELAAALESLSDAEREVIVLWAWEGLEPRQIATVLETNANAISLRLTRAKKKLAAEIVRQDPGHAGHKRVKDPEGLRHE